MALPEFNMRQLLEAGVHFGHQTHRWNPKMASYIFGDRNGIHIIDLSQTTPLLHQALVAVRDTVANGGRVLFVGTKRQASEVISRSAQQCAQYYMNSRWLGGTLTNWKTISNSIKRLRELEGILGAEDAKGLTKKEVLNLTRERNKLDRAIGGIKDMGGIPDIMVVIDTNKESIAIAEAHTLSIPVVAILDSNCNPDGITYPIPGNDDATRAIELYCDLISKAVIDGIEQGQSAVGVDLGAQAEPMAEAALEEAPAEEVIVEAPAEEVIVEAPAEEVIVEAPAEEVIVEAPAKEVAKKAPAEEVIVEAPAKEVAKKAPAKKAVAKKAVAKKAVAKKAVAKKAVAKKAPAKEVTEEAPTEEATKA